MFLSKNDKDFHQKSHFLIDVDEKRNGFLYIFAFFLKNDKDFHQKCYFLSDFNEKRNAFFTFLHFSKKTTRILIKSASY